MFVFFIRMCEFNKIMEVGDKNKKGGKRGKQNKSRSHRAKKIDFIEGGVGWCGINIFF